MTFLISELLPDLWLFNYMEQGTYILSFFMITITVGFTLGRCICVRVSRSTVAEGGERMGSEVRLLRL